MSAFVYPGGPEMVSSVGGQTQFACLKRKVKALSLPDCPFCGGIAEVCMGRINTTLHLSVMCSRCKASTKPMVADTAETALTDAVSRWKLRQ